MLTPAFHFTQLLAYIDTMNVHAKVGIHHHIFLLYFLNISSKRLAVVFEDHCENELDVYPYLKRFTLDVICGERIYMLPVVWVSRSIFACTILSKARKGVPHYLKHETHLAN